MARSRGPGGQASPDVRIEPLTRGRLPDLAQLFGQGGDPKWCWCAFWRIRDVDFRTATAASNRRVLEGAVRATSAEGRAPVDDRPVWSIVCFVVSRRARGRGIATALLDAAVDYARDHGATLVEAYPADPGGGRIPAASAYKGTVSMFERAGFEVVARRRANSVSAERPIVRRRVRTRRTT